MDFHKQESDGRSQPLELFYYVQYQSHIFHE